MKRIISAIIGIFLIGVVDQIDKCMRLIFEVIQELASGMLNLFNRS